MTGIHLSGKLEGVLLSSLSCHVTLSFKNVRDTSSLTGDNQALSGLCSPIEKLFLLISPNPYTVISR